MCNQPLLSHAAERPLLIGNEMSKSLSPSSHGRGAEWVYLEDLLLLGRSRRERYSLVIPEDTKFLPGEKVKYF